MFSGKQLATKDLNITPRLITYDLVTWVHRGPTDKLVVCFSGIGKDVDSCPPCEFARTASGNGQQNVM